MKPWMIAVGGFSIGMIVGLGVGVVLYLGTTAKVLESHQTRLAPAEFLMRLETAAAVRNGNDAKALHLLEVSLSSNVVSFGMWQGKRTPEMEKALWAAKLYRQHVPAPASDFMAETAAETLNTITVPADFMTRECPSELRGLLASAPSRDVQSFQTQIE